MKAADFTDFLGFTNTKSHRGVEPDKHINEREELGPKKVLMSWKATPKAGTKSLDPRFKRALMIAGLLVLFLFILMQEFFLILVVASLAFFSITLGRLPEQETKYEITTHGVHIRDEFYYWDELESFFFTSNFGKGLLAINLKTGLPPRVHLGFHENDKDKLRDTINIYIRYMEKEPTNFVEQGYLWMLDKFDFEEKK